jgi:hypothetical protein
VMVNMFCFGLIYLVLRVFFSYSFLGPFCYLQ